MTESERKNLHEGHRARLRERIERNGIEGLADREVLEYLLFFVCPRADTNPLAHRLIECFGSLRGVLEADPAELARIRGMGNISSQFLTLLPQLSRRYLLASRSERPERYVSLSRIVERLQSYFLSAGCEQFVIMTFDCNKCLLGERTLAVGNITEVPVHIRTVIETVLKDKAAGVIAAHNHMAYEAKPSMDDFVVTQQLKAALRAVDVELIDHVIVCQGTDYYSFAEEGEL